MGRLTLLVCLTFLPACGAKSAGPAAPPIVPEAVLLVQIDGLSPDLLEQYLRRPASRSADRALHSILGASAPGGGRITYDRAAITEVFADPGADPYAHGASLVTGLAPAQHGVWAGARALPAGVPSVFERIKGRSVAVGVPGRGASKAIPDAALDAARLDRLLPALKTPAALVAVRFSGVVDAAEKGGADAGPDALGVVDAALAKVRARLPAATLVIISSNGALAPRGDGPHQDVVRFAQFVGASGAGFRAGGGVLFAAGLDAEQAAKLDGIDFTTAVFGRTADGVALFDSDLGSLRPLFPDEFPDWPGLGGRLERVLGVGGWLAVANRAGHFDVGESAVRVARGGLDRGEAVVPLIVAGPMLAQVGPGALDGMSVDEIAATIEGALSDGAQGRWPALRARMGKAAPPAQTADLVTALGGTLHPALADAAAAFRRGDAIDAAARLGAIEDLPPEAEAWRAILHVWASRRAGEADDDLELPPLEGWPAVIGGFVRLNTSEDDAPPLPALPAKATGRQRTLYRALQALYPSPRHACTAPASSPADALAAAAATFAQADLPGLAALAQAGRSKRLLQPADIRTAHLQAMRQAGHPDAGWAREGVYRDLLMTSLLRTDIAAAADAELTRIAELLLLELQAKISADSGPEAGSRNVGRVVSLVDGVAAARRPALLAETVEMAVRGQGATAAAVVRSLIMSGGISGLFTGNPIRSLQVMLTLMDKALAEVRAKPVAELTPDERVARVVPHLISASLKGLQGAIPAARQELAEAGALLPDDAIFTWRAQGLQGLGEDDEAPLATWAPFVKATVIGLRGFAAILADDHDAAQARALEGVALTQRLVKAEFARAEIKGLDAHVDALADVLRAAVRWGWAAARELPDAKLVAALRSAVQKVPLEAPTADAAVRPWLTLAAVLLHDVAWAADPGAAKGLSAPTAAMDRLIDGWRPESKLGQAGLLLLLTAQHTLPDLGKLKDVDDAKMALEKLPRLTAALKQARGAARALFPTATVGPELKADRAERVVIENILLLLEAGPDKLLDPKSLLPLMTARNAELYAMAQDTVGDARDLLILVQGILADGQSKPREAVGWAARGLALESGPAFAGYDVVWHTLRSRWLVNAGDTKGAERALFDAQQSCPPLAWRLAVPRAVLLAKGRDPSAAADQFRTARIGGRKAGVGGYGAMFTLSVQDGQSIVNTTIGVPLLGAVLGRLSGTFQVGAGGSTNAKQVRNIGWQFTPAGSPVDAAVESLALEAWMAMTAGDEATAGAALSRIMTAFFGLDPRHLDGTPPAGLPPIPPGHFLPRSPRLLVWVATLAELHGHEALGGWVLQQMAQRAQLEWDDTPGGVVALCDDATREKGAGDDAPPLVEKMFCDAPAPLEKLLGEEAAEAFGALVDARLRARAGQTADPKKALAALRRANKRLVPAAGPGRQGLAALRGGKDDSALVRRAVKAGYACEIAMFAEQRVPLGAALGDSVRACGPAPYVIGLAVLRAANGPADRALEDLRAGIEIVGYYPHLVQGVLPQLWPQAWAVLVRPDQRGRLLERSRTWAELADRIGDAAWATRFRAAGLAAQPASATAPKALALLRGAWKSGERRGPALRFLKQVARGENPRTAAEGLLQ